MSERTATCSCGQLTAICSGDPVRVSICHCHACQRRTGSAFGVQARFVRENVRVEGASTTWIRTGDSGGKIEFHFCPTCGATVFYGIDALPEFVVVPVGAFADGAFPPPSVAVYEARRHGWVPTPSCIADHYD